MEGKGIIGFIHSRTMSHVSPWRWWCVLFCHHFMMSVHDVPLTPWCFMMSWRHFMMRPILLKVTSLLPFSLVLDIARSLRSYLDLHVTRPPFLKNVMIIVMWPSGRGRRDEHLQKWRNCWEIFEYLEPTKTADAPAVTSLIFRVLVEALSYLAVRGCPPQP